MIDIEREELSRYEHWQTVLEAYQLRHESAKREKADFDGWLPRIEVIEGVDRDELSKIHGVLMALDFLNFQLTGRTSGIHYQITTLGRKTLVPAKPTTDSASVPSGDAIGPARAA